MKKFLALLLCLLTVCLLSACKRGKWVDVSQFDEGEELDAGISSHDEDYNQGDPYNSDEIGRDYARRNLYIVFGDWDNVNEVYLSYEYDSDVTAEGKPAYLFSQRVSKEQGGEYRHRCYIAVYKDGSGMTAWEKPE